MRTRFKVFIIILIFVAFGALVLSSELFTLKNIYVTGNKTVSNSDIIRLSNLQYGQNIFRMNKKKIIRSMFENPKVKAARIKRILPSSVSLDIIEREAIALVPYLGSYLNIDEEAMIFEVSGTSQNMNAPVIEGFSFNDFKIGEVLKIDNSEQLDIALKISNALKNSKLNEDISIVNIEDLENILLITRTGIRIYLCNSNIDYKIQMAKTIIEDLLKNNEKGIIDMRHDGNPIFKRD
jgi:cell division protein FtsQ